MTKKNFLLYLSSATVLVLAVLDLFFFMGMNSLPLKLILIINVALLVQFVAGGLIVVAGKHSNPESFAQRFLLLTTFQLLSILAIILVVWYGSKTFLKPFLVQYVGLFAVLMIGQTLLLLRLSKSVEETK